jgi:hypothetical protein
MNPRRRWGLSSGKPINIDIYVINKKSPLISLAGYFAITSFYKTMTSGRERAF